MEVTSIYLKMTNKKTHKKCVCDHLSLYVFSDSQYEIQILDFRFLSLLVSYCGLSLAEETIVPGENHCPSPWQHSHMPCQYNEKYCPPEMSVPDRQCMPETECPTGQAHSILMH